MPVVIAADGIVVLGLFAIALALILLRRVWVASFGHLLLSLAEPFDHAGPSVRILGHTFRLGFQWVASLLRGVNSSALHLLGAGITATDSAAKTLWHWTAYLLGSIGRVIGDFAESVEREISYLASQKLPAYVHAALHPLASKVEWLIRYVEHTVSHPTTIVRPVTRIIDPRVRVLERQVQQLAYAVAHAGTAIPLPALPRSIPTPRSVLRGIDDLRARLTHLSRLLAPAAVAGLVAAALVRLRVGWLKCSNVERTAKHLCGLDADVLDALLAETVAIFGTVGLVEFAGEMEVILSDIMAPVRVFWRV